MIIAKILVFGAAIQVSLLYIDDLLKVVMKKIDTTSAFLFVAVSIMWSVFLYLVMYK